MESITSTKNPKVKRLLDIQQSSKERRASGLFVVEGRRELQHCLCAGYEVDTLFFCPDLLNEGGVEGVSLPQQAYTISSALYERIAYRGTTEGMIALVRAKGDKDLNALIGPKTPLFIVLERVEKPGNLGAILRSADAAGITGVIVCDPLTDLYNPNLIRASLGAIFTVPTVACTSEECIDFLKRNRVNVLTAQLQDSHLYYETDMTKPTAIVMGTESTGLTEQWRRVADAHIRIPMLGQLDSLNVSVSAAILMYEAVRQRKALI
ncbi:MAG: RNA methyltransferase [Bacteroidaceae bacterium]|nr:RNA methyltransferase [Bacteroidaceae bacterium]